MEATDAGQDGLRAGERRMSNEDVADTKEDRMTMLKTMANITRRRGAEGTAPIKGEIFRLLADCANDMYKDRLATIPAGTCIVADFAGDFGMYGMVEIDGVLHKVKIDLSELHKINFGRFDARDLETEGQS